MNLRIRKPGKAYLFKAIIFAAVLFFLSPEIFSFSERPVSFSLMAIFFLSLIYDLIGFDLHFNIPRKWNDLTEWQLQKIGHYLFNNDNKKTESDFYKNLLVCILFIPKPTLRNILKFTVLLSRATFPELQQHTNFVFDKTQYLTRFPKSIKVGRWPFRKVVYGPADRLANITIQELSYADTFFYKWVTEDKDINLHQLTAILYRPADKKPTMIDIRSPFVPMLLDKNAELTDKIPLHIKFMIAYAYEGCRANFIAKNKNVFPVKKVIIEDPDPDAPIKKPKPYQPFSKIIDSMAMDDVQIFGPHQDVEKVLAPTFLKVYDESIVRQREMERQQELRNRKNK